MALSSERMISRSNSSVVFRSVAALRSSATLEPLVPPTAASTLFCCRAPYTSEGVIPSAAIRSGFSQARMAKVRSPRIRARCTPLTVASLGCTSRTR